MKNNQPHSVPHRSGQKTNTTQTYSQTTRSVRNKTKYARRVFIAKCITFICMLLVLGGGVYLLYRTGIFGLTSLFKGDSPKSSTFISSLVTTESTLPPDTSATTEATTTTIPNKLTGYTVIIDPGHGGDDHGCGYPVNSSEIEEEDVTLTAAGLLEQELLSRGAKVYVTRKEDKYISLYNRVAQVHLICMDIAKERGILPFTAEREQDLRTQLEKVISINDNDYSKGGMGPMAGTGAGKDLQDLFAMEQKLTNVIFISLHLNADYDENNNPVDHHGIEVTYVTDTSVAEYESKPKNQTPGAPVREAYYGRSNENNLLFCQCLYDGIIKDTPILKSNMDKPVYTSNWAVTRKQGLVGTLLELGFISDANDRAILSSEEALKTVCSSIADSIQEYFKKIQ